MKVALPTEDRIWIGLLSRSHTKREPRLREVEVIMGEVTGIRLITGDLISVVYAGSKSSSGQVCICCLAQPCIS